MAAQEKACEERWISPSLKCQPRSDLSLEQNLPPPCLQTYLRASGRTRCGHEPSTYPSSSPWAKLIPPWSPAWSLQMQVGHPKMTEPRAASSLLRAGARGAPCRAVPAQLTAGSQQFPIQSPRIMPAGFVCSTHHQDLGTAWGTRSLQLFFLHWLPGKLSVCRQHWRDPVISGIAARLRALTQGRGEDTVALWQADSDISHHPHRHHLSPKLWN